MNPITALKEFRVGILHDTRPLWKRVVAPYTSLRISVTIEGIDGTKVIDKIYDMERGEGLCVSFPRNEACV